MQDWSKFDLAEARAESPAEMARAGASSAFVLPATYPEDRLYALLRALFGRPAGMMSFLNGPEGDPDAPFKWDYYLRLPDGTHLSIARSWRNIEVRTWGGEPCEAKMIQFLERNLEAHKEEVNRSLAKMEPYRLIINPHYRHRRMMEFFLEELRSCDEKAPPPPKSPGDARSHSDYGRRMERQNSLAASVVVESAFTAESYLNMMIALLRNDELANGSEMLGRLLRESWRKRVKGLPRHCKFIRSEPDLDDSRAKEMQKVFELRNRIAHSYPDTEHLRVVDMWFDRKIPVLKTAESYELYQLGVDSLLPTRDVALACPEAATAFVEFLNDLASPRAAQDLKRFSETNPLGFNYATGRYSIPFGPNIVMGFPGERLP